MAVVVAMALDAMGTTLVAFSLRVPWLDLVAVACLVTALCAPGALRSRSAWRSPLDGRVIAGLLVSILLIVPGSGESNGAVWLRQSIECALIFYSLLVLVRSQPGAAESLWDVIAGACVLLSAHALLGATSGLASLRSASEAADAGWAAQSGLFKSSLLVSVLCAGRAMEHGSGRGWRVLALLGVAATVVHAAAGGTGLHSSALTRLDSPIHFSNVVVMLLLLSGLLREAWDLRRSRREEASRWRGAALAIVALAGMGVFGGATGGEGLRALTAIVAVLLVATGEAPSRSEAVPFAERAELRRAA